MPTKKEKKTKNTLDRRKYLTRVEEATGHIAHLSNSSPQLTHLCKGKTKLRLNKRIKTLSSF